MAERAKKTDPKLWDKVKQEVTDSSKGGKPGQWSARKAQMATSEYKKQGGDYEGAKSKDNHLKQWTDEKWDTKSGEESGKTGERYLPEKARESLSSDEYARSTRKKRADTAKGQQHSKQPADVAKKSASARKSASAKSASAKSASAKSSSAKSSSAKSSSPKSSSEKSSTKAELMKKAREKNVSGRSAMSKAELARAVGA